MGLDILTDGATGRPGYSFSTEIVEGMPGLARFYLADDAYSDGGVTKWPDRITGAIATPTQAVALQPVLSSIGTKPTVRFGNGCGLALNKGLSLAGAYTIYFLLQPEALGSILLGENDFNFFTDQTKTAMQIGLNSNPAGEVALRHGVEGSVMAKSDAGTMPIGATTLAMNSWNAADGRAVFGKNGVLQQADVYAPAPVNAADAILGAKQPNTDFCYRGHLRAFMVFNVDHALPAYAADRILMRQLAVESDGIA